MFYNGYHEITNHFLGVSYELCDPQNSVGGPNSLVGYSIRLESNISRNTRLAFVTNGIALRMLESGSGNGGQGTALDDITVGSSFHCIHLIDGPPAYCRGRGWSHLLHVGSVIFLRSPKVHERTLESDFLLIILQKLLVEKPNLKCVFADFH